MSQSSRSAVRPLASQLASRGESAEGAIAAPAAIVSYQGLSSPLTASCGAPSLVRSFQTSARAMDIDSAAKYIGAGAATVGVAGSGMDKE